METTHELNARIMNITVQLQEHYPELYRMLNEMRATLPDTESPVINTIILKRWLESLNAILINYDLAHLGSNSEY